LFCVIFIIQEEKCAGVGEERRDEIDAQSESAAQLSQLAAEFRF
jgi:hypothetical protein